MHDDRRAAAVFLAPAVALFLVFIVGPTVGSLAVSLFKWNLITPPKLVGLANFERLFSDPIFLKSLANTIFFSAVTTTLQITIGLALALAVNRRMPRSLGYFLRSTYFFPVIVSWAAASLMWRYALDPNFGFINVYLHSFGFDPPNWLASPVFAMPTLILVNVWRSVGFTFIVLLAGLQSIPPEFSEAASVDGAGAGRRLISITLPMLSPSLLFVAVINLSDAFQVFDPVYIMTNGGPANSTLTLMPYMYNMAFRSHDVGYASVIALAALLVLVVFTAAQFRFGRRWVFYDRE